MLSSKRLNLADLHISDPDLPGGSSREEMAQVAAHATALHESLQLAVKSGDDAGATTLLGKLKISLSELGLLFPDVDPASKPDVGALTAARDILEIGAFHSLKVNNVASFERYLSLLSAYYTTLSSILAQSVNEAPLTALSLLRLLSQNRIAEFHTVIETLSPAILESKEVVWVSTLEQHLMSGSYSRVWSLCKNPSQLPRAEFGLFVATLVGTVRGEIASCDERAYETLPVKDAKGLLFFDNESEVRAFAHERGWHIDTAAATIHFPSSPGHPLSSSSTATTGVPSALKTGSGIGGKELDKEKVVSSALAYARELESIV